MSLQLLYIIPIINIIIIVNLSKIEQCKVIKKKIKIIFFIKVVAKISAIIETVAKKRKYKDRNQKRSFFCVTFTGRWSDEKKKVEKMYIDNIFFRWVQ